MLPRARRRRERPAGAQEEDAADRCSQNAFHEPSSVEVSPLCRCRFCCAFWGVISQKRIPCQGEKKSERRKKTARCRTRSLTRRGKHGPGWAYVRTGGARSGYLIGWRPVSST